MFDNQIFNINMKKKGLKRGLILFALVFVAMLSTLNAQDNVVINPVEYTSPIRNPIMGFREWSTTGKSEWATTAKVYIAWNKLENSETDGIDKILSYTDAICGSIADRNFKIIPRVYLDYPGESLGWPSDMTDYDYTSEQFKARVVALIEKLGYCWDNDPRIAYVEMGIIGKWGEQHSPSPNYEMQKILGKAFVKYFKNKQIIRRYGEHFLDYNFGIYWDSWAHWNAEYEVPMIRDLGDFWKTAIVEGETAYNYGDIDIQAGDDPDDSLLDTIHRNWIIDYNKEFHCSGLGWISQYSRNNPDVKVGADIMQLSFGYRFVIDSFSYPKKIEKGVPFNVSFSVINKGSAPFYYNWPVELSILDADKKMVWKGNFNDADITTWLPGDEYNRTTREYDINAEVHKVNGSFTMNQALAAGQYTIALSVIDPSGNWPALRLSIINYFNGGRHPMGYVGVDATIDNYEINTSDFDNMYIDKSLHYYGNYKPAPAYNLKGTIEGCGSISPVGGLYAEGETVTITAKPDDGWHFIGWSGDLSGTTNPAIITMDAAKNITATFDYDGKIDPRLVARWKFDEGEGLIVSDVSGNGHYGTITGNPTWVTGKSGTAIHFADTSVYMDMPESSDFSPHAFTIAMWVKWPEGLAAGKYSLLEHNRGNMWVPNEWYGVMCSGDELYFERPNSVSAKISVNTSDWYYLAVSINESGIGKLYFNGIEIANANVGFANTVPAVLRIGANNKADQMANAIIDEVSFFNTELSISEIKDKMNEENTITYSLSTTISGNGNVLPKGEIYQDGATVKLTAMPDDGWSFVEWAGDISSTSANAEIVMDADKNITVSFVEGSSIYDVNMDNKLQVNPNPFKTSIIMKYSVQKQSFVKLSVFNMLGKNVGTLVDKEQSAGEYTVSWTPQRNADIAFKSGVYVCKLQVNTKVSTIKIILQ